MPKRRAHIVLLACWLIMLAGCTYPAAPNVSTQTAVSAGCVTPTASQALLPVVMAGTVYYVAPDGSPNGDGSIAHPWDLSSAISGDKPVLPGNTIFLRGGTYTGSFESRLTGLANAPIILRQYQNEWPRIDGTLNIKGAWTNYWGFEVFNSAPNATRANRVMVFGPHTKLIDLVIHDSSGSGIGTWSEAPDSEIYGSIIYNNGRDKFNHGIYVQNQTGMKNIVDNIIFDQSGYGIHGYGLASEHLVGIHIEGNVAFNNGIPSANGAWPNILVGGDTPAEHIEIVNNYTYQSTGVLTATGYWNADLGYDVSSNKDIVVRDNYFVRGGTALHMSDWAQITLTGNTLYDPTALVEFPLPSTRDPGAYQWNNNTYYSDQSAAPFRFRGRDLSFAGWQSATGLDRQSQFAAARPTGAQVFVRPNKYEPGRANIVVYNWDLAGTVDVDVSGVLAPGAQYSVWNAQDYFGAPVATGVYDGTSLRLPMTAVHPPPALNFAGRQFPLTGPEFNVFVLKSTPAPNFVASPTAVQPPTCTPTSLTK